MKPNLLVINPAGSTPADWLVELCNRWMEHCYVYLMCPGSGLREDNDYGVRFLSHREGTLPHFGVLAGVVAFEENEALRSLCKTHPNMLVRVLPVRKATGGTSLAILESVVHDLLSLDKRHTNRPVAAHGPIAA